MIDFIFPWVNPHDPDWQKQYKFFSGNDIHFDKNPRFRENPMLRYVFRSVESFAPWIDRVVLIASSKSQLLPWMNTDTIKVVEHKDFIPERYLPVFNSTAIEMFLARIPDISENFIYSNDDCYFLKPTTRDDFFEKNMTPKFFYSVKDEVKTEFQISVKRAFDAVRSVNSSFVAKSQYLRPSHHMRSMNRSVMLDVYRIFHNDMASSITRFRDNKKNINQYIYWDYAALTGKCSKFESNNGAYISIKDNFTCRQLEMLYKNPGRRTSICINDNELTDVSCYDELVELMDTIFPNKSRFEQ